MSTPDIPEPNATTTTATTTEVTPTPTTTQSTSIETESSIEKVSEEVKDESQPQRAIVFGDEKADAGHVHVSTGAGFPRTGTKEMRRELTKDDKELANAGYSDLKVDKKEDAEGKHVDIVSRFYPCSLSLQLEKAPPPPPLILFSTSCFFFFNIFG